MKKKLICLAVLAALVAPLIPAEEAEARCGRGGIFRGRIRARLAERWSGNYGGCQSQSSCNAAGCR